jgi:hypothetical protein
LSLHTGRRNQWSTQRTRISVWIQRPAREQDQADREHAG